jgi:hypothetical protein
MGYNLLMLWIYLFISPFIVIYIPINGWYDNHSHPHPPISIGSIAVS